MRERHSIDERWRCRGVASVMRPARRRKLHLAGLLMSCGFFLAGCSWFGGGKDDIAPEKLYTDKPCTTECCCTTKKGYYVYFRCLERAPCEQGGGECKRPDLARCTAE